MLLKIILLLVIIFFAFRGTIRRRWPDMGRRVQWILVTSLVVVTLYRVVIWWTHTP